MTVQLPPDSAVVGLFSAERPLKKEESFRDERRKMDPAGIAPRGGNPVHRSGPANRAVHPLHPPPGLMGPPGSRGGSGSHKDIKLTLLNKVNVTPVAVVAWAAVVRADLRCTSALG